MPGDLAQPVVIVTGGGSGIGRATALCFAERGAGAVVVADVDSAGAAETVAAIEALGCRARALPTDVSRPEDAERLVATTVAEYGRVDVLVNNAAVILSKSAHETSPDEWARVIGVNLTGAFLCSHYALPHMLAQGRGAIVNLASPHAFQTGKYIAAYAASKGGIVALTRQMALDYGRLGVRVNCVVPGAIDTPMLRADIQQGADWEANLRGWERNQPIGRLGQPADVAKVIVWLASDDAAFVLGAPIIADGGLLAQLLP
jgi:NAD(P)-dependent dehydrogenase (short-subunit alcohol dehydrogenase family)